MKKEDIEEFYRRLEASMPEPETELAYKTPYELVVAVALSAQATDVSVNAATAKLFPVANTPEAMIALGEEGVAPYIKTIGLWRNKAKNVIALSRMLIEEFSGKVPQTREELQKLPGVGRKTADVVLNVAFGQPTIAVDTHIFRVSNRTGLASGKTADQVSDRLVKRTPAPYLLHAHHWLILHGRYVCKARTPECWRCEVADLCGFKDKTPSPEERAALKKVPGKKPAKKAARKKTA
ncbi:endonuclease III [Parvularcula maris]